MHHKDAIVLATKVRSLFSLSPSSALSLSLASTKQENSCGAVSPLYC